MHHHAILACAAVLAMTLAVGPDALHAAQGSITTGSATAAHRGLHELSFTRSEAAANPFTEVTLRVTFTRPDGSTVGVDGFYDGGAVHRARAYCDRVGTWRWASASNRASLNGRSGSFVVGSSALPGKLRRHARDTRQFAYDDGRWFLHVGDTGYRYVCPTEPLWRDYIDQAAQMGATKVRTWFNDSRYGVQGLWEADRAFFKLAYWQTMEERIRYAYLAYPGLNLQLIPYGEDSTELGRYLAGDNASKRMAQYAQARFSAFPNVQWCVSNDRDMGNTTLRDAVDRIATDMRAREPWGTLLTNHQVRRTGYAFPTAAWSDIVTLEDIDQVTGARILEYRARSTDPVVNDEDRYESYIPPANPRYFFRRLMWASLLSGGHATYGGARSWEAYSPANTVTGVRGYFTSCANGTLKNGAHDFKRIAAFFAAHGDLVGMRPADGRVGNVPARVKCSENDSAIFAYLANPSGTTPSTDAEGTGVPSVTVAVPTGTWSVTWFDPTEGGQGGATRPDVASGTRTLAAPGPGDWILVLRQRSGGNLAPSVALTAPASGTNHAEGAAIAITATASDADGSVAKVAFYRGTVLIGEDASSPYGVTWSGAPTGSHALTARATDNAGAVTTSAVVSITVGASPGATIGINLNGGAVTIDGMRWRSQVEADAAGFSFTTARLAASTAITPVPAVDADTRSMLNSAVWNTGTLGLRQALANGGYEVSLYVMENYQSGKRSFDVRLEGTTVASGIGHLALGAWRRYGPYPVTVGDGALDVTALPVVSSPHLMGIVIRPLASGALPAPWSSADIGSVGAAGSASVSGGRWTVSGSGADIWGTADGFHLVSQPLDGDGEITARIVSQTATDPWAKAGVMIRESTSAGSRHALMAVTPSNGLSFQRRVAAGGSSSSTTIPGGAPAWVRLTRVGDTITASRSSDGSTWNVVGSAAIGMGSTVRIGLAVSSHRAGTLSTAVFDQVTVIAGPSGNG